MKNILPAFAFLTCCCLGAFAKEPNFEGVMPVKLDNGLTVLLKEDHRHPVVSAQVWVRVGSVNETVASAGLSHFLEHLIFKGTAKYPGDAISRLVENQGGMINAATSKEFTEYYIDTQATGWKDAVSILADAMANANMPAHDIDKERPVVIEEISRSEDNPSHELYDVFNRAMFVASPYRERIIGSADVIKNTPRSAILEYYHTYYVPSNMFFVLAGDFVTAEALAHIKDTFGKQSTASAPAQPVLIENEHDAITLKNHKEVEQSYWMGGFLGPVITQDKESAIADIVSSILGGGRSSRLYRVLREEKQLAYSIWSSYWSQRGSGILAVGGVYDPKNEKALIEGVRAQIDLLAANGPTEAELLRAKQVIKTQWVMGNETYHDQATQLAYWHLQGNPGMLERYLELTASVSGEDVRGFMKKYCAPARFNQAILSPKQ
jgi:zinc protease